ncbi:MAG TPA: M4 family metallopeptidase [Gaiellaceae bacterium]|nr:M4 family metallopeptidase [Gaiellaceae bacterium]
MARLGALLVLLGLVTVLGGAGSVEAQPGKGKGVDPALVKKLKAEARGSVALSTKQATKHVGFVRAGQNGDLLPGNTGTAQAKAKDFLSEYGQILGAGSESTLEETSSSTDALGATHVTYQQYYKGVPVWAATIKTHVDARGNLSAVNGIAVPDLALDTTPRLSAAEAGARAVATVAADPPTDESGAAAQLSASDLHVASAKLYVYRLGLPRGAEGTSQLVYEVTVTNDANVRDVVFVHANAGKIVNRYSTIHDALFRRLFEMNTSNQVWQEGDPFPGLLNQDQQNIVNFSGESYRFFNNSFGRDSYDGAGAEMRSVNNDPTIACPNANWNGATTNYCNGVTSDDVVAHEWGHAYTQFTHDLIYQWQSGALNESYSDIWGETVDFLNLVGTDSPGGTRTVGSCSTHTAPRPNVVINSPAEIARTCNVGAAQFGPPLTTTGVTGNVVLGLDDTAAPGPTTTDACSPLTNAADVAGNIALVDRGGCGFTIKVKNAQNAGAVAVLVADNVAAAPAAMAGVDPTITIPSVRLTLLHGNLIRNALPGVNVTLRVGLGTASQDSYRWLVAEDSTAFGGAIRDMWNPNCISDPGKVTDGMYHCTPDDGGGVHSNSGVPNHGYALLVDGGMYNGVTVNAIGLTKAAHLYFRAQSTYQTPTTDFEDHADALEQSCTDLIGQNLETLSTGPDLGPSGQSISAADCSAVTAMIAAIELRADPTDQCQFRPLLDPNTPALCSNQKNPPTHYHEDFEDGLAGWTLTNQGVFAGWPGTNWTQSTSLPGGRAGSAAFGEDLKIGNCDGGAGDVSGVMRLQSPSITLPSAAMLSPRLTFQHYIATELGWDGGNVKISVNGGPFSVVPASAFTFNPYNQNLNSVAQGNTNPLAGEPGFTGTDGGEVGGSWGESQIDLTLIGVKAGDTIQLRFDMGMDGCTGIDGWYVDDIKLRSCNTKKNEKGKQD